MAVPFAFTATEIVPWALGLLGFAGALGIGHSLWRGGTGQALSYLREANSVLTDKLEENEDERRILREQLALLETRTSLEPMVAAVIDQFEAHEGRARERHDAQMRHNAAMLNLIDVLGQRLGRDKDL